ncbi:putative nuclease HARBI1 [Rhagoletis pomonella]|uniref:putative nuclease HARBI1 n=1 Tax=Rhagoletis pomonella TaxID=28610 RepID=UPI00177D09B8|nr:putative nuclease HARBI1 [Rhagoletis pomonella]
MDNERLDLISQFLQNEEELMSGNAGVLAMLNSLPSSSSSESSSSSDESEREEWSKCENFCEVIEGYNESEFKAHMRLRRSTVEFLIEKYASSAEPRMNYGGRESVPPKKKVFIYIWYISNTVTFRQLANLFGVSSSTAWAVVKSVSGWLITIGHEYIKWPQGTAAEDAKRKFEAKSGLPGVIGAIDCTHIRNKAPEENKENYFDRKHTYSLVLQAVVDADKRFTDVTCGEPGSLHDSRVLRRSSLFATAQSEPESLFPNDSFILGDSAYPATSWLVPPFKDYGNLSESQRNFNKLHSSTRIVVENAFGLLKTRFRRLLHFTEQTNLCFVVNIIVSACILHNICLIFDDLNIGFVQNEMSEYNLQDEPIEDNYHANGNRRDLLFEYLQEHNLI